MYACARGYDEAGTALDAVVCPPEALLAVAGAVVANPTVDVLVAGAADHANSVISQHSHFAAGAVEGCDITGTALGVARGAAAIDYEETTLRAAIYAFASI